MFCPPSPIYPTRSPPPHVQGQSKGCKWIGLVKEGKLSLSDIFPTFQMFTKRCSGPDIQSLWVFCHLIFVGNNYDVVHRSKMTKTLGVSMRPASHSIISLSHSIISALKGSQVTSNRAVDQDQFCCNFWITLLFWWSQKKISSMSCC